MTSETHDEQESLRACLKRLDAVLGFALRLRNQQGSLPPGLLEDFREARRAVERAFVAGHDSVPEANRKALRELILQTRNLDAERLARHVERLATRVRGIFNQVMIGDGDALSLTEELVEEVSAQPPRSVRTGETTSVKRPAGPEPAGDAVAAGPGRLRSLAGALAALLVLGGLVAGGWFAWQAMQRRPAAPDFVATNNAERPQPGANASRGNGATPAPAAFNPAEAGYNLPARPLPLQIDLDPLREPGDITSLDLCAWLLGFESQLALLEPERLRMKPEELRERMRAFSRKTAEAAPGWAEARKPMFEAYIEHARAENLALYPESEGVLLSDVLALRGGGQFALVVALCALGRAAGLGVEILSPQSTRWPLLGRLTRDGAETFDGRQVGLRALKSEPASMTPILREFLDQAWAGVKRPEAQLYLLACRARLATPERGQLAGMLDRLEPALLTAAGEAPREVLLRRLAARALSDIAEPLAAEPGLTGAQAVKLLGLVDAAPGAKLGKVADTLVARLEKLARPAEMLGDTPLALVLAARLSGSRPEAALLWLKRAHDEFPDDHRAALSLFAQATGEERAAWGLAAYARGARAPAFLRELGQALLTARRDLEALAIFDDLCAAPDAMPADAETGALVCIALGRADWAQERLARARARADTTGLLRLDLICELSRNGLNERARALAAEYRKLVPDDAMVEDLLRRHEG